LPEAGEWVHLYVTQTLAVSALVVMRETTLSGLVKNDPTCVHVPDATTEAPAPPTSRGILKKALSSFAIIV
jgi:hypothetical protein